MRNKRMLVLLLPLILAGCNTNRLEIPSTSSSTENYPIDNRLFQDSIQDEAVDYIYDRLIGLTVEEESTSDESVLYGVASRGIPYESHRQTDTYTLYSDGFIQDTESESIQGYSGIGETKSKGHSSVDSYFLKFREYPEDSVDEDEGGTPEPVITYETYRRARDHIDEDSETYDYRLTTSKTDPWSSYISYIFDPISFIFSDLDYVCDLYKVGDDGYVLISDSVVVDDFISNPLLPQTGDPVQVYERTSIRAELEETVADRAAYISIAYLKEDYVKTDFFGDPLDDVIISSSSYTVTFEYGSREGYDGAIFGSKCRYKAEHVPELSIGTYSYSTMYDDVYSWEPVSFQDISREYSGTLKAQKDSTLAYETRIYPTPDERIRIYPDTYDEEKAQDEDYECEYLSSRDMIFDSDVYRTFNDDGSFSVFDADGNPIVLVITLVYKITNNDVTAYIDRDLSL